MIEPKLEDTRHRLLDLTRRNRLLEAPAAREEFLRGTSQRLATVLQREFAMPREALVQRAIRCLRFGRSGASLVACFERAVDDALEAGEIGPDGEGRLALRAADAERARAAEE